MQQSVAKILPLCNVVTVFIRMFARVEQTFKHELHEASAMWSMSYVPFRWWVAFTQTTQILLSGVNNAMWLTHSVMETTNWPGWCRGWRISECYCQPGPSCLPRCRTWQRSLAGLAPSLLNRALRLQTHNDMATCTLEQALLALQLSLAGSKLCSTVTTLVIITSIIATYSAYWPTATTAYSNNNTVQQPLFQLTNSQHNIFWTLMKHKMIGCGSSISWTIHKSFVPRSRQTTMPAFPHIFTGLFLGNNSSLFQDSIKSSNEKLWGMLNRKFYWSDTFLFCQNRKIICNTVMMIIGLITSDTCAIQQYEKSCWEGRNKWAVTVLLVHCNGSIYWPCNMICKKHYSKNLIQRNANTRKQTVYSNWLDSVQQ